MTTTAPYPCGHGMPNAATCVECMFEGPVAPPVLTPGPEVVDLWIVARFNSNCPKCGNRIVANNERVGFTEVYGWVCETCGEAGRREHRSGE